MKIEHKLQALYEFGLRNRRTGTSTIIKEIAKTKDIYIVVDLEKDKENFESDCVTFTEMERSNGKQPKPYLIDNHALSILALEAHDKILYQEFEIDKLKSKLSKLKAILEQD